MQLVRWVVFSVAGIAFLALLSRYDSLPNEIAARLGRSPETELAEAIAVLRDRDPKAADALQSLTDARRRQAIEAMLRAEKRMPEGDSIRVAERLAKDVGQGSGSTSVDAARYELALLASDPRLVRTRTERNSFIAGNATVVDAIGAVRVIGAEGSAVADVAIADYLSDVEKVAAAPAAYRAVADDPIGIMLFDEERDAKLRQFYLTANANHDHPDWLKAVIAETVQASGRGDSPFRLTSLAGEADEDEDETTNLSVGDVVRIAYDNHPLFQQIVFDDLQLSGDDRRPTPVVVALFREHGELSRLATGPKGNVPRSEILDVLFANDDFLERWRIDKGETDTATLELVAHFANLQKSKPGVWREARYSPLALQLEEAAPRHANEVLEEYGPDDIATLLLSG